MRRPMHGRIFRIIARHRPRGILNAAARENCRFRPDFTSLVRDAAG
jgi:hypothetical protein